MITSAFKLGTHQSYIEMTTNLDCSAPQQIQNITDTLQMLGLHSNNILVK